MAAVPNDEERRLAALTVDETEIGGEVPRLFLNAQASRNFARSRVASPTNRTTPNPGEQYEQIFVAHRRVGVVEIFPATLSRRKASGFPRAVLQKALYGLTGPILESLPAR